MQPTFKFKKTLLASALMLGLGNAFMANSETFTITASAIADVGVTPVSGYTSLSFGEGIKGEKVGEVCTLAAASVVQDSLIRADLDNDGNDDGTNTWAVSGNACTAGGTLSPVVLEIDGADTATVSVSIPDVVETGYTWIPGAESCVMKFTNNTSNDTCETFSGKNQVTGVTMANNDEVAAGTEYDTGTARMIIGGTISITGTGIANGSDVSTNILVQVTYE
jgi:hypothetical protein